MKTTNILIALAIVAMAAISSEAETYFSANYGNYTGSTICYNDVIESSGTDAQALYNAPTIVGNTLNFNPTFTSYSEGAGATDTTDGQLGFDICAIGGNFIDELVFSERGDYSLNTGFSGNGAYADVSASFFVEILEVDYGNIDLLTPLTADFEMTFSPNADGTFVFSGFLGNDGNWNGNISMDIESMLDGIAFNYGATKIHLELDNRLRTGSQDGTSAYIAKKDFQGFSVTSIPEPGTATLLGGGSLFLISFRRRFSGLRHGKRSRTCGSYTRMIINHLLGRSIL